MNRPELWLALGVCLVLGAIASTVAKKEAAALGLTALELALLTGATGAYVTRKLA